MKKSRLLLTPIQYTSQTQGVMQYRALCIAPSSSRDVKF